VLIRDTLYDGLTSARRLRMYKLAVAALEQLDDERPGPHLADLAHHSIAAREHDKGLHYARQAAGRALELLSYDEAARLFRLALDTLARQPPDPTTRSELLLAGGDALAKAGSMAEAKEMFLAACDLARAAHLPESFARAALGYGGYPGWQRAGGDTRLVPLLEEALRVLGEDAPMLRARLLARLAGALRDEPSLEPRSSLSREAVEIARRLDDKETLAYAEQLEEEALRAGRARSSDADCSYRLAMFILRRAQGRLSEIENLTREAVDEHPGYRSFRCFIPLLEWELGREDEARRAYSKLAEANFAALPPDSEWLFCLSLLA
jgi:tetratricopeptide (TPR) repeat protein